eukprot:TRINITY_DN30034_c0_g1_i1.p1 TRINITY_DN30034_c0_g1~~TRINITY_DN30034_c0_g1_i1.p1  ORF type:complete len:1886 (-),score=297.45 TRINITY_DN30034_c0_g1_i1:299-5752(-)
MLHATRRGDLLEHDHATMALYPILESVMSELKCSQVVVPMLAIRLVQGDYHVLHTIQEKLRPLLPSAHERILASAVCGLLSFPPPPFTYQPTVCSGILSLAWAQGKGNLLFQLRTGLELPVDPKFAFRVIRNGILESPDAFEFLQTRQTRTKSTVHFEVEVLRHPSVKDGEVLDIYWQAWPRATHDIERNRQSAAMIGIETLEKLCEKEHISWFGQAHIWWKELGVHPLFQLLAAGDIRGIRLAADLLGLPELLLAFLFRIPALVKTEHVRSILLADLCSRDLIRDLSEQVWENQREKRSRAEGESGQPRQGVRTSFRSEGNDKDSDHFNFKTWLSSGVSPADFPDELMQVYLDKSALNGGGAAFCPDLCGEKTFKKLAREYLLDLRDADRDNALIPKVLNRSLRRWSALPLNLHLLLSTVLTSISMKICEMPADAAGDLVHSHVMDQRTLEAPDLSMFLALAKLNQARGQVSNEQNEVSDLLMAAMWGLEVNLRQSSSEMNDAVRREFGASVSGICGFKVPMQLIVAALPKAQEEGEPTSVTGDGIEDWLWEEWTWPEDKVVQMFLRIAQTSRLAIGCSRPLQCWHPSKLKRTEYPGWEPTSVSRDLLKDLFEHKPLDFLFDVASAGLAGLDAERSLKAAAWFPTENFEGLASTYAAVACMFTASGANRTRAVGENQLLCMSEPLRKLLPSLHEACWKMRQWTQSLCNDLGLDAQSCEAVMNIAHGLIVDQGNHVLCHKPLMALASRLRLTAKWNNEENGGVRLLCALCTSNWSSKTRDAARVLASQLGISNEVVHGVIEAAKGEVSGWMTLHRVLFEQGLVSRAKVAGRESEDSPIPKADVTFKSRVRHAQRSARSLIGDAGGIVIAVAMSPGAEDPARMWSKRMQAACNAFNKNRKKKKMNRWEMVKTSLQVLIKELLTDAFEDLEDYDKDVFLTTCRIIMHVLSGENVFAAALLHGLDPTVESPPVGSTRNDGEQPSTFPDTGSVRTNGTSGSHTVQVGKAGGETSNATIHATALGLSKVQSQRLMAFVELWSGCSEVKVETNENAYLCLVDPLTNYIEKGDHVTLPAEKFDCIEIPFDVVNPVYENLSDEQLANLVKERTMILLDCVFALSSRDAKRTRQTLWKLMDIDAKRFGETHKDLHWHPSGERRFFAAEKMTPQIRDLLLDDGNLRQSVVIQMLDMVHHKQGQDALIHQARKPLSSWPKILANKSCTAKVTHLRPTTSPSCVRVQSAREIRVAKPASPLYTPKAMTTSGSPASLNTDGEADLEDAFEVKSRNVLEHFFVALAASNCAGGKIDELRLKIGEFCQILPVFTAIGSGSLELMVSNMRDLVEQCLKEKWDGHTFARDMNILMDVLSILFVSKAAYIKKVEADPNGNFAPALFRRVFELIGRTEAETECLVNKLVNILIGVCVEADMKSIQSQIVAVLDPLRKHVESKIDDAKLRKSICAFLTAVSTITKMVSEGEIFTQKNVFHRPSDGEPSLGTVILMCVLDLVVPFLPDELREPLKATLTVMVHLEELAVEPTKSNFEKHKQPIVEGLAGALGLPRNKVNGVVALAQGEWAAAADLCRCFCNLDPKVLTKMSQLLPQVRDSVGSAVTNSGRTCQQLKAIVLGHGMDKRARQIYGEVLKNQGSVDHLFELTDLDKNGKVSLDEFTILMKRLGFNLNKHRLQELVSKGIGDRKTKGRDLDVSDLESMTLAEFQTALGYLEERVKSSTNELLGNSWVLLMFMLFYLTGLLSMICVFIGLGMSGFRAGGTFNAVINSVLTLCAGLGIAVKSPGDKTKADSTEAVEERVSRMVDEVSAQIYSEK